MPVISSLGLSAFSESKKDAIKSEVSDSWFKMCGGVRVSDNTAIGVALPFPHFNSSANSTVDGEYTYRGMLISTTPEGDIRYATKPISSSSGVSSYTSSVSTSARRIAVGTESQGGGIYYARLDMFDTNGNALSSTRFYSSNTTSNPLTFLSGIAIPERNGAWNTTTSQTTYENVTDTVGVFGKVNNTPIFFDFFPDNSRKYVGNTTFTFSTLSEITCACEVIESGNKYYYIAGRDNNATKDLVVYKIGPASASPAVVWQKKYAPFSAETGGTGNRWTYAPVAIRYDKHVGKILVLANYVDTSLFSFNDATIPNDNNTNLNSGAVLFSLDPSNGNTDTVPKFFHPYQKAAWATGISIGDPHPNATNSTDLLYNTAYFISMTSSVSEISQSETQQQQTPSYICSLSKGELLNNVSPFGMVAGIRMTSSVNPGGTSVYRGIFAKVGGYSSASLVYTKEPDVSASYVVYNVKGQAIINSGDFNNYITPSYFSLQLEVGSTGDNTKYTFGSSFVYTSKNEKSSQLTLYTYSLSAVTFDPIHQYCQTITYPTAPSNTISNWITGTGSYTADTNISNYIGTFTRQTFDLGPASYNPPLKAIPNHLNRILCSVKAIGGSGLINILYTNPQTGITSVLPPGTKKLTITDGTRTMKVRIVDDGGSNRYESVYRAFFADNNATGDPDLDIVNGEIIFITKYAGSLEGPTASIVPTYVYYSSQNPTIPTAAYVGVYTEAGLQQDFNPLTRLDFQISYTYIDEANSANNIYNYEIPSAITTYGTNPITIGKTYSDSADSFSSIIIHKDSVTNNLAYSYAGSAFGQVANDTLMAIGTSDATTSFSLSSSGGNDKLVNAAIGLGRVSLQSGSGNDRFILAGHINKKQGVHITRILDLSFNAGDRVDLSLLFKSNGVRVASTTDLSYSYQSGNLIFTLSGYYLSWDGTFANSMKLLSGSSLTIELVTQSSGLSSLLFNQGTTLATILGTTRYNKLVAELE